MGAISEDTTGVRDDPCCKKAKPNVRVVLRHGVFWWRVGEGHSGEGRCDEVEGAYIRQVSWR